ncbi:NAD(P)-dependent oxidoreductase [Aldersonia kunmingensis]|uniref:NAD(P)-dependent oxidoreductase n=1 Tax=Aldersonia kunmingensis TaxID=408066 RepID=UPI0008377BFC|nr:NAD(P)-binding oxidoreductase [Aldersonia kunmingensis]
MKVLVVGASRGTGTEAVAALANAGHLVTAFARTAGPAPEGVRVITGDVFDKDTLTKAMIGQDAVVVTLGISDNPFGVRLFRRAKTPLDVRSAGTERVIEAMHGNGIRRLVVQTTYGVGETYANLTPAFKAFFRLVLAPQVADSERQEEITRNSGLDWTLIRPVALHDGREPEPAHVDLNDGMHSTRVSREQVGRVHADAVERPDWIGATVSVSN